MLVKIGGVTMKWIILALLIALAMIFAAFVSVLSEKVEKEDKENKISNEKYYSKGQVLTDTEVKFYNALLEATAEMNVVIYPVMSLKELVYVVDEKGQKNPYKYFNKINKKHIDFTLCEPKTAKILGCIELDDATHNQEKRYERDQYVDKVLAQAGIKLLRYKTYKNYDIPYLKHRVEELLSNSQTLTSGSNPNTYAKDIRS